MRVFLSYSRADTTTAEAVAANLKQAGHEVFFDRDSIKVADDFNRIIWGEIQKADLFVFLISPNSVRAGSYALTELALAEKKWPNPEKRVLPVVIESTSLSGIPVYASICHMLHPEGNVAAEVRAEVGSLNKRHRRTQLLRAAAIITGLLVIGLLAALGYREYLDERPFMARAKLEAMSVAYDKEKFIDAVYRGDEKLVNLFLTAGMDPNVISSKGFTALQMAIKSGHFEMVKKLLHAKADVNAKAGSRDVAALAWAAARGQDATVGALLAAGANTDSVNEAFVTAASSNNLSTLRLLLTHEVGQAAIDKAFVAAAGKGESGILPFLLDKISDRLAIPSDALLAAAAGSRKDAIRLTDAERIATFRYLLGVGADVNVKDKDGITPLIWVVYNENSELAGFLLENDADPDVRCKCKTLSGGGWTALTLAIRRGIHASLAKEPMVDLLLASGADVNLAREREGKYRTTPMMLAAESGDPKLVSILLEKGANVNDQDPDGYTALAYAARNEDLLAALLGSGADVHAGANPLLWAVQYHRHRSVEILLAAGADVNKTDSDGQTPLMMGAQNSSADMVLLLLAAGARTADKDTMGRTAETFAKRRQHDEIVKLLQDAGK